MKQACYFFVCLFVLCCYPFDSSLSFGWFDLNHKELNGDVQVFFLMKNIISVLLTLSIVESSNANVFVSCLFRSCLQGCKTSPHIIFLSFIHPS